LSFGFCCGQIAASAPQFAQGVIDPITELAAFAKSRSIGMHVDSCLGGFLLPFMESIGRKVEPFDFRVPGVTSMSADPHKFGFTPKGVSCVLYADAKLRRYQYFVAPEWTGGIYASPTIAGSRPGGLLAGAWAAMMSIGQEGYQQYTKAIVDATQQVADGVRSIAGLKLCGEPDASVVCFASNDKAIDVYKVAEAMSKRHWNLNSLQNPSCVHLCLTNMHVDKAEQFIADLKASVEQVRSNPSAFRDGSAAMYGMAASIPDKSIVDNLARAFVDTLYKTQV
jgi:sphinganine-1-phosphate aldolase